MSSKNPPKTASKKDPRYLNETSGAKNIGDYFDWYSKSLTEALSGVKKSDIESALLLVASAIELEREIWVAGNGGSASIADHLCCDWTKGTHVAGKTPIRTRSLMSNIPVLTAMANDFGYENSLSKRLEMEGRAGDVLLVISSSGNSENIVNVLAMAKKMKIRSIAFTGFEGGKAAQIADVSIHVAVNNYGIVEDCHQILMHSVAQFLAQMRDGKVEAQDLTHRRYKSS